jgi:hypothetical protein
MEPNDMIQLNNPLPVLPTNEALASAFTLLAVAADPAGTRARLDELTEQVKVVHSAIAEHDAARLAAEQAQKAAADLVAAQAKLADDQAAVAEARLQNDNAAAALRTRETELAQREAATAKLASDLAVREKLLADRVASYRQALA